MSRSLSFSPSQRSRVSQIPDPEDLPVVSTSEAARMLGVSNTTVQFMVERGELKAWKTRGGHRRIRLDSIDQLRTARGSRPMSLPGEPPPHERSQLKVLLVEEDAELRELYTSQLMEWGLPLRLQSVEDGVQALVTIERNHPDVLILNLPLAGMDGLAFIRRLRRLPEFNDMTVVVAGLDASAPNPELPAGVVVYDKPPPLEKLHGFLEAVVARKSLSIN